MSDQVLFEFGNLRITERLALIYGGVAVFVFLLTRVARIYWRRRLTQWAAGEQLQLVSFRGAWFFEGPSAWTRSRNQHVFRVVTLDRNGMRRFCWIMFGTFWGFIWGEPLSKVVWDDDDS